MNEDVLHEFLVKLGFKVDSIQYSKMEGSMLVMTKHAVKLTSAVLAVTAAAAAMANRFSQQMEKMYYSAQQTGETVGRLQAFSRAAKQIGLDGDAAVQFIKNFDLQLKSNPGRAQQILGLGVTGKNDVERMFSLLEKLSAMPDWMAFSYAGELFGASPEDYLQLKNNLGSMKQAYSSQISAQKEAGDTLDKNAEKMKEYSKQMKLLGDKFEDVGNAFAVKLIPALTALNKILSALLDFDLDLDSSSRDLNNKSKRLRGSSFDLFKGEPGFQEKLKGGQASQGKIGGLPSGGSSGSAMEHFKKLEAVTGIPATILDKVWATESNRGKAMYGPRLNKLGGVRALGHAQFLPSTGKQYGLNTLDDFMDFEKSTTAMAQYLRDLKKMFGGDLAKALAAYNWGPKNVRDLGLGEAPGQTRGYLDKTLGAGNWNSNGVVQNNNTTIEVHSTESPEAVGRHVGKEQSKVNARAVRDLGGRLQ